MKRTLKEEQKRILEISGQIQPKGQLNELIELMRPSEDEIKEKLKYFLYFETHHGSNWTEVRDKINGWIKEMVAGDPNEEDGYENMDPEGYTDGVPDGNWKKFKKKLGLNESIGLSILGGALNMAVEHLKEVRKIMHDDDGFKDIVERAVEIILSGEDDDEPNLELDNPQAFDDDDEYHAKYDKNMTQGFK